MSTSGATPAVSLVLVTWNSRDDVVNCLRSAFAHPPAGGFEAVVVDNGSSDGTVEAVRAAYADAVTVIANPLNRGLAFANNQGMAATTGRIIVISNSDVLFGPDTLDQIVAAFDRLPRAGLLAIRVVWPDGVVQTSTGDLPEFGEALLGRQVQRARSVGEPVGYCWDGWPHDEERMTGRAGDACFAARRAAVATVGAQDERFPLDWEAIDWSRRMRAAGWEIWFTPAAVITHIGGGSTSRAPAWRWVWQTHQGMARYFSKTAPTWCSPLIAALFALRAVLKWGAIRAGAPMWRLAHRGSA